MDIQVVRRLLDALQAVTDTAELLRHTPDKPLFDMLRAISEGLDTAVATAVN